MCGVESLLRMASNLSLWMKGVAFIIIAMFISLVYTNQNDDCTVLCQKTKTKCTLSKHYVDYNINKLGGDKIKTGAETVWIIYEDSQSTVKYVTNEYEETTFGFYTVDCYTYKSDRNEDNFKPLLSCSSICGFAR